MSVLCKVGLHRWRLIGSGGLFAFPISECRRCGAVKVADFMTGSRIIPPEDMMRSKEEQ